MKKRNILRKSIDFTKIIKSKKPYVTPFFKLYNSNNKINNYRIGISVPTKTGNAVKRNKIKRQIKNILDKHKNLFILNMDYIIIVRREILNLTFYEIEKELIEVLSKKRRMTENE